MESKQQDEQLKENNRFLAEEGIVDVLQYMGEDVEREGLQETPARYLKFLNEFCNPPEFKFTTFDSDGYDQMIVQTNIPFFSLCEHHMVPFYGHASVAYIPSERIVGLSKLARTVEWYSRRLQNQERITKQVADKLTDELKPLGVAVLVTARHLCMEMRGVRKHDTHTTTSMVTGVFADDPSAKAEFMEIVKCR